MYKIYSRPRLRIPKINENSRFKNPKIKKILPIIAVLIIAFIVAKVVLDAVFPIFDTLCEAKAKSIATIVSNEQATNVMKNYTYEDLFYIQKDKDGNVKMIGSNMISINEIISDVAIKIQEDLNNRGKENIEIALRKFYRI